MSNLNNFHSLEIVETQLLVGENSDWIIWRLKGYLSYLAVLATATQHKRAKITQIY